MKSLICSFYLFIYLIKNWCKWTALLIFLLFNLFACLFIIQLDHIRLIKCVNVTIVSFFSYLIYLLVLIIRNLLFVPQRFLKFKDDIALTRRGDLASNTLRDSMSKTVPSSPSSSSFSYTGTRTGTFCMICICIQYILYYIIPYYTIL